MQRIQTPPVYVANAGRKGRGVFAARAIKQGEVIEVAPVVVIPARERKAIFKTQLGFHVFEWSETANSLAQCLGYGSLYNHSYQPNAETILGLRNRTISFIALRSIKKGEEITHNYRGENSDESVWFTVRK